MSAVSQKLTCLRAIRASINILLSKVSSFSAKSQRLIDRIYGRLLRNLVSFPFVK